MANSFFQFKQFTVQQDRCAMKVTTDACLFGGWIAALANPTALNALDIGAGTGLLSLMLAQKCGAEIKAIEIDPAAAEQAQANMDASPWKDRLQCIQGNVKDSAFVLNKPYTIIISNPPFYENELQSGNQQKNIAHHSTQLQLEDLLGILENSLATTGEFYLLFPYKRHEEIEKLFASRQLTITRKTLVKQSTRHDYFRIMLQGKGGKTSEKPLLEEIAIKDEKDQYTPEFVALLKDYYLYL